jgi:hypothetical protein
MVHAWSFHAYADVHLEKSSSPADAEGQPSVQTDDSNGCIRMRIKLNMSDEKLPEAEQDRNGGAALGPDMNGMNGDTSTCYSMFEEDPLYEDPVFEGPGPGYQCPLNDCSFKTDLKVRFCNTVPVLPVLFLLMFKLIQPFFSVRLY